MSTQQWNPLKPRTFKTSPDSVPSDLSKRDISNYVILKTRYGNLKLPLEAVGSKKEAERRLQRALPHVPVDCRTKLGWLYRAITNNWDFSEEIYDYQRAIMDTREYINNFNKDEEEIRKQRQTPEHITAAQKFFDLRDKILKKTF